jgi:prephenate dehydratase
MNKIESRPNKSVLGEYVFFIDIEGSVAEPKINNVLEKIKKRSSFFKLLGSYKRSL